MGPIELVSSVAQDNELGHIEAVQGHRRVRQACTEQITGEPANLSRRSSVPVASGPRVPVVLTAPFALTRVLVNAGETSLSPVLNVFLMGAPCRDFYF